MSYQKCPKCKVGTLVKMGFRVTVHGRKQRVQCQKCGASFYEDDLKMESNKL